LRASRSFTEGYSFDVARSAGRSFDDRVALRRLRDTTWSHLANRLRSDLAPGRSRRVLLPDPRLSHLLVASAEQEGVLSRALELLRLLCGCRRLRVVSGVPAPPQSSISGWDADTHSIPLRARHGAHLHSSR